MHARKQMEKGSPNSTSFLSGIAVHWYRDNIFPTTLLNYAHTKYPNKFILNTESSIGKDEYVFKYMSR